MSAKRCIPAIVDTRAPAHVPLTAVIRGEAIESLHYGSVAVVDGDGRLLHSAGDPQSITFTRSALKPLQALSFVRDDGPARYGYSQAQIALLCASHSGEPRHVAAVSDMLARAGNEAADLGCGTHAPGYFDVRGEVPPPPPYSALAHNCSGKHAGMLACCAMHGWRKSDYLAIDHPLQQTIRGAVARFAGVAEASLVAGIDGCSAPNYAMPLTSLARAFARLAVASADDPDFGAAPRTLREAMIAHPEMVSGEGRSDIVLAQAGRGDWVPKIGAEGVQAIGVSSRGLGIAIKVADGHKRGLHPATVAVLDQLGLLDDAGRRALAPLGEPALRNYRGMATGRVRPVVVLDRA
ncbi:MAG: asparaginase [Panacagrimonas sp.]